LLILTRRIGEKIIADDNIVFTVLQADRYQVSIGIDAPKNIIIHREEIYNEIKNENRGNK
jgi:carbon storage regulator